MGDYQRHDGGPTPNQPDPADRLDSWKEIAAFLKRDVRTVQRWEKQVGLPVYRHTESRLRTAYAYRSELENWWRIHRERMESADSDEVLPERGRTPGDAPQGTHPETDRRSWIRYAAAAAVALLLLTPSVAYRLLRADAAQPPTATAPVRIVLAAFDNSTGDASLGALLDAALERELAQDDRVDLLAPTERTRILRLMRRAPDAPVTRAVARELSIREGSGAFIVAGRVQRLTSTYLVVVDAVDPSDGGILASVEREAADRRELHAAAHAAADQLGGTLADRVAANRPPAEPLQQVTTSSLTAVRLYTQAITAGRRRQWPASEMLARRAIDADQQFAAAYAWTAWAMRNQGRPAAECLLLAQRALELAPGASDRETYFVRGTYDWLRDDTAGAAAAFEALVRLSPSDRIAVDRLIESYTGTGRVRDAVEHSIRRADAAPQDFYANVRAAHALRIWNADSSRAEAFVGRSRRLITREVIADQPRWTAWLTLLPAFERWLAGDPRGVLAAINAVAPDFDVRIGRERDAFASAVGFSYLSVGRIQQAAAAFSRASTPTRQIDLALLDLAVGRRHEARDLLLQIRDYSSERPALFARVGLLHEAELGLETFTGTENADGLAFVTRGLIAARRHDEDAAIDALRRGVELLKYSGEPEYFIGVESLARLWLRKGDQDRAVRLLTEAVAQRRRAYAGPRWSGAYCLKLENELATLLERLGRSDDARSIRADLDRSLVLADADFRTARETVDLASESRRPGA